MPRITISYRRDDSGVVTGRIFDRLIGHYGRDAVFRDIDNIPLGVDFRKHIEHVFDSTLTDCSFDRERHLVLQEDADVARIISLAEPRLDVVEFEGEVVVPLHLRAYSQRCAARYRIQSIAYSSPLPSLDNCWGEYKSRRHLV